MTKFVICFWHYSMIMLIVLFGNMSIRFLKDIFLTHSINWKYQTSITEFWIVDTGLNMRLLGSLECRVARMLLFICLSSQVPDPHVTYDAFEIYERSSYIADNFSIDLNVVAAKKVLHKIKGNLSHIQFYFIY